LADDITDWAGAKAAVPLAMAAIQSLYSVM
jgi:hypothetical protein